MSQIINKIGFIIVSPRQFDYYKNIYSHLNKEDFDIVINDDRKDIERKRNLAAMNEWIGNNDYSTTYANEILQKKQKYKIIVSTHSTLIGSIKLHQINIKKLSQFLYVKLFGKLINKTGLSDLFNRFFGKTFTGTPRNFQSIFKNQTYSIGKKKICFPRGMDISEDYPGVNGKHYNIFFCHGTLDQELIQKKTKKETFIIGYPRYDSYHNNIDAIYSGNPIFEEFKS